MRPSFQHARAASAPADVAPLWDALRTVIDPELGHDVVTLGLVYDVTLRDGTACVTHSLTTPRCPLGHVIQDGIRAALSAVPGVQRVDVHLVWDPEWHPGMIAVHAWGRVP